LLSRYELSRGATPPALDIALLRESRYYAALRVILTER
jgi:hypothetical protein